jgi:hypothetical protein
MLEDGMTIEEMEKRSGEELQNNFPTLLDLMNKVNNLGWEVRSNQPGTPQSDITDADFASRNLFSRLLTDVYAAANLAFCGYSTQTATLVSSSFEVAFMVMYIGKDNARALKWIDNKDPYKFAETMGIKNLVTQVLTDEQPQNPNLATDIEIQYEIYKELCSIKHANIHAQGDAQMIIQEVEGQSVMAFLAGPDPQPRSLWYAAQSMYYLFALILKTAPGYINNYLPQDRHQNLNHITNQLVDDVASFGAHLQALKAQIAPTPSPNLVD